MNRTTKIVFILVFCMIIFFVYKNFMQTASDKSNAQCNIETKEKAINFAKQILIKSDSSYNFKDVVIEADFTYWGKIWTVTGRWEPKEEGSNQIVHHFGGNFKIMFRKDDCYVLEERLYK